MEKGKGKTKTAPDERRPAIFHFSIPIFLASALAFAGCGTPGDPTPPRPVVPVAVTDLAARQQGDAVVLTFTLPAKSTDGEVLKEPPDVEVFRRAAGAPKASPADERPLYTVPSALVDTYLAGGRFRFSDPLKAEVFTSAGGAALEYKVRARASQRRASEDSNLVSVRVFPAPEKIASVQAEVTPDGIELRWPAPERTIIGTPLPSLGAYRVFRSEVAADASQPASPATLVGVAPGPSFRDTQFEFGKTYTYTVRSVAQYGADSVESADSEAAAVMPRDTFPPATPRDVVIVFVPATAETPALVELSWAISVETDLAGYHVYRSGDAADTRGERVNRDLLLVPAFRDIQVAAGRRYSYRIAAVDRAGNESPPSAPVTVEIPKDVP